MPTDPPSLLTLTSLPIPPPPPPPPPPMENPLRGPYLHTEFGIMAWKFHRSQGHFSSDVFVAAPNPSCYLSRLPIVFAYQGSLKTENQFVVLSKLLPDFLSFVLSDFLSVFFSIFCPISCFISFLISCLIFLCYFMSDFITYFLSHLMSDFLSDFLLVFLPDLFSILVSDFMSFFLSHLMSNFFFDFLCAFMSVFHFYFAYSEFLSHFFTGGPNAAGVRSLDFKFV